MGQFMQVLSLKCGILSLSLIQHNQLQSL